MSAPDRRKGTAPAGLRAAASAATKPPHMATQCAPPRRPASHALMSADSAIDSPMSGRAASRTGGARARLVRRFAAKPGGAGSGQLSQLPLDLPEFDAD